MTTEECVIYKGSFFQIEWYYDSDGIYVFKPQPDRYLCFFKKGKKIIVTNAYRKQTQKLPKSEKDLALKNMADYLARNPDTEETK